jgi:hypothetical protein
MDQKREDEWLMHVAAGTDPLMALAALPRDMDEEGDQSEGRLYRKPASRLTSFLVLLCLLMTALLFLL